ncbi:MAG: hypothetical protein ACPGSD_00025 [Flavobacteriales bacterium]
MKNELEYIKKKLREIKGEISFYTNQLTLASEYHVESYYRNHISVLSTEKEVLISIQDKLTTSKNITK